jgi:hypothetical protein
MFAGSATTGDLLTSPEPIPAGTYVTIGFSQDLLGALNVLTSWRDLAAQWVSYLGWPTGALVVNDTFGRKDAVVAVQITGDATVGQVASIADAISPDVSILHVWINGEPPSAATLQTELASNATPFAAAVDDPLKFVVNGAGDLLNAVGTSLLSGLVPWLVIGGIAFWGVTYAEKTRTYRKYVA